MNGVVLDPILAPGFIWGLTLLLGAGTSYVYLHVGARLSRRRNAVLLALRLLALAGVLLLLWQPSRREQSPERKIEKVLLVGIDGSRSMRQQDAGRVTRLDAAKNTLRESKLVAAAASGTRFFHFDTNAGPLAPGALDELKADGPSTSIHRSVSTMLGSLSAQERGSALILLSDGHDFELTNPGKTAALARERRVPIYAIPFGQQGHVRDASVNIVNFEPYSYAKQKARISASIRLIGCEHERLTVQLLRQSKVVQTIQASTGEHRELPVEFEVTEPEAGQYEYEVRVPMLPDEIDPKNNSAITFLNVIDQRIRILLLEGAPYWDTTFLRRTLAQNDKIDLDAIVQYTKDKARRIRSVEPGAKGEEPVAPQTQKEFNAYDLIILGQSVDSFFDRERFAMLVSYVKEHGGTVLFSRGQAFTGELGQQNELEPMQWQDRASDRVSFRIGREGQLLSPFRVLAEDAGGVEGLPALLAARQIGDRKTLSAALANALDPDTGAESAAMIHRRLGRGQVLSVAVEGLWRWSFNPKAALTNNVFDRFWDQLILWLVAAGDSTPSQPFSFRTSTANLVLGAKMTFRLSVRDPELALKNVPITVYSEEKELARTTMTASEPSDKTHLSAEYLPAKPGRYRAVVNLPGSPAREVKWMVFDDNAEEKEVAADVPYLKALCESTGGKLLEPGELPSLLTKLQRSDAELLQKVRLHSVWDHAWLFYIIGALFGLDWYLRRKWGLC